MYIFFYHIFLCLMNDNHWAKEHSFWHYNYKHHKCKETIFHLHDWRLKIKTSLYEILSMKSRTRMMHCKETAQTRIKSLSIMHHALNKSYKFIIEYIVLRSAMKLICTRCWLRIYCLATVESKDYQKFEWHWDAAWW